MAATELEVFNQMFNQVAAYGGGAGGLLATGVYLIYRKAGNISESLKKNTVEHDKISDSLAEINKTLVAIDKTCAIQGEKIDGLDKRVENIENAPIHNGDSADILRKLGKLVTGDMHRDLQDG